MRLPFFSVPSLSHAQRDQSSPHRRPWWQRRSVQVCGLLALVLLSLVIQRVDATPSARPLAVLPANFTDAVVATIGSPTALDFTPDGRLLVTTQPGQLRIYQNGALLATPALNLASKLCSNFERGLLGVAVDPDFATTNAIYLFYTFNKFNSCPRDQPNSTVNPINRVARFTLPANNVIAPASEVVVVDNIPSKNGNHNGGDIHFGGDGLLYISVGDNGALSTNSGLVDHLAGKILRVNKDGTIPAGNPYAATAGVRRCSNPAGFPAGSGPCAEVFAQGLRNPFRFAFRPGTTQFYINDVGQSAWEEINEGSSGADYGWCRREGPDSYSTITNCQRPANAVLTAPLFAYNHSVGCSVITGGVFVPDGVWPAPYANAYLFGDYGCGKILRLVPGTPNTMADFATGLADDSVIAMIFGPHGATQALYYLTYAQGGQVRRITYTGAANRPPTAVISANPVSGAAPLTVNFSGAGSSDPDAGDTLIYNWDFGDGTTANNLTTPTTSHTYSANGVYNAALVVRDNRGASSVPARQRIDVGNSAPTPIIVSPAADAQFTVNQYIVLQGSAQDAQDGTLPASALLWSVFLHHVDETNPGNVHTHPLIQPTAGNNVPFVAPDSEDMRAAAGSYVEIRLTATDASGLATTVTRALQPQRVNLSFATQPTGLQLTLRGETVTTPRTIVSWVGGAVPVVAATQVRDGVTWQFSGWSDGGAAAHTISTPGNNATFTATFSQSCSAANLLKNPGFEDGKNQWKDLGNSNTTTTAANVHSGIRALKVGTGSGGRKQEVTLQANQTYDLTAWAKLQKSGQQAWLRIHINGVEYKTQVTTTSYQPYTLRVTAPASFASKPYVSVWKASTPKDYVYFDDLSLRPICASAASAQVDEGSGLTAPVEVVDVSQAQQALAQRIQNATAQVQADGSVVLNWSLLDPTGIAGFALYRAQASSAGEIWVEVSDERIAAEGRDYAVTDALAAPNTVYTYWLLVVGEDGSSSEIELAQAERVTDPATRIFLPLVNR